jgi:diguanylate cyclase (GGDEF)-like protein/PAS domain S-box-containing protein
MFLKTRQLSAERDLLAAALVEAPDYFYVKDRDSRFVAVNMATARFNGFGGPKDMLGLTDFNLTEESRARRIFEQEQQILHTGTPILEQEELLAGAEGDPRWFSTSKVPLHDKTGQIIGLAGVTHDVTEAKRLREELMESRDVLSYALAEMSDGLAMFDGEGRLIFCNRRYQESFPLTGHLRVPGTHLRDILSAAVASQEQLSIPQNSQAWIESVVENLRRESEEEVNLFDGRWLRVRTRPASAGATLVVVSDFTRIKQAELQLYSTTHELREMVRTDSLTGLLNRRAFDEALETETRRSARTGTPLSLLLIDVDRFKAFNDHYGHPAGDACLKLVSHHLRNSLKRPGDLAARYGGEEFAAILPETDEDGAYLVAEGFRKALVGAKLEHRTSEKGIVTASVGVATYGSDNLDRSGSTLLQTADEALYSAKAAGRDRVFGRSISAKQHRYAGL